MARKRLASGKASHNQIEESATASGKAFLEDAQRAGVGVYYEHLTHSPVRSRPRSFDTPFMRARCQRWTVMRSRLLRLSLAAGPLSFCRFVALARRGLA